MIQVILVHDEFWEWIVSIVCIARLLGGVDDVVEYTLSFLVFIATPDWIENAGLPAIRIGCVFVKSSQGTEGGTASFGYVQVQMQFDG